MLIEGCKIISATPSKATAKVQLFCEICKGKGYFVGQIRYAEKKQPRIKELIHTVLERI